MADYGEIRERTNEGGPPFFLLLSGEGGEDLISATVAMGHDFCSRC